MHPDSSLVLRSWKLIVCSMLLQTVEFNHEISNEFLDEYYAAGHTLCSVCVWLALEQLRTHIPHARTHHYLELYSEHTLTHIRHTLAHTRLNTRDGEYASRGRYAEIHTRLCERARYVHKSTARATNSRFCKFSARAGRRGGRTRKRLHHVSHMSMWPG